MLVLNDKIKSSWFYCIQSASTCLSYSLPESLSLRLSMPLTSPWSQPFKYYVLYPPRWIVCLDSYPFFLFPISLGTPTLRVKNLRLYSFCLQISDDIKSFHYFMHSLIHINQDTNSTRYGSPLSSKHKLMREPHLLHSSAISSVADCCSVEKSASGSYSRSASRAHSEKSQTSTHISHVLDTF